MLLRQNGRSWTVIELKKRFHIKNLGEANVFFGSEIMRNRADRNLFLAQIKYMQAILEIFRSKGSIPALTTMEDNIAYEEHLKMDSNDFSSETVNVPYREAIDSFIYLMVGTWPYLTFAIEKVSNSMSSIRNSLDQFEMDFLRYVSAIRTIRIYFYGSRSITPHGYRDSYWAGDVSDSE